MGSYGIGPARVMGAIVETNNDPNGIIWPKEVAPYGIHIIPAGENSSVHSESADLYTLLTSKNIEVLWDDRRDINPGSKFADADLIGCPMKITLSTKNIDKNQYELKKRSGSTPEFVPRENILAYLEREL